MQRCRVAVGLLPKPLGNLLAKLEPYGFLIILGLLLLPSLVLQPMGINFDPIREIMVPGIKSLTHIILFLSGHNTW